MKIPRGMRRHVRADGGDLLQLGLSGRVGSHGRRLPGQLGVPLGEKQHGVAGNVHRQQLLPPGKGLRVAEEVQRGDCRSDLPFEIEQALAIDLVVQHRMARRPLLHEFGEQAGVVGLFPLRRERSENLVAHAAAAPIGNDLYLIDLQTLLGHGITGLGPGIEDAEVFQAVTGQLGVGRHDLGLRAALADDQLALPEIDRLVPAKVMERAGAHYRHGELAFVGLVEVGQQAGSLGGQRRPRGEALLSQASGSWRHDLILTSCNDRHAESLQPCGRLAEELGSRRLDGFCQARFAEA